MDDNTANKKVLGLESALYVKICYGLILVSGVLGLVLALLGMLGLGAGGSGLLGLLGLAGLIMALVGAIAFARDFTVIELSHLKFLSIVFVVFYVTSIALGYVLGGLGILWSLISLLIGAAMLLAVYLGFRLWIARQEPTQATLAAEFHSLKNYLQNRSDL